MGRIGVILSLLVSVLAVRALGETDVNPVSGVGKLSQVLLNLILLIPSRLLLHWLRRTTLRQT